jgi:uncharacterized protein (TIGR02646 family)
MINITKSQPAPKCLAIEKAKKNGSYNCGDVFNRLSKDFYQKCYICEYKSTSLEIEHFRPKGNDINLTFDWNNLFLGCRHCNNTKLAKYDNIIDCTDKANQVLAWIKLELKPYPKEKVRIFAQSDKIEVDATIKLLHAVYNGTTEQKQIESGNLRDKITKELADFKENLSNYFDDYIDEKEQAGYYRAIQKQLRPDSEFTAFKVWIVWENEVYKTTFASCIDWI